MTYHLCIDKTLQGQPYANRQGFPKISSSHPERVARATQIRPGRRWRSTKSRDRFASRCRTNQRVFAVWLAVSSGKKATAIVPKGSELFLVDSSGWVEFLEDGP